MVFIHSNNLRDFDMDHLIEVYEVSYSAHMDLAGGVTEHDVTLATLWNKPEPSKVPHGCTVSTITISESVANEICE